MAKVVNIEYVGQAVQECITVSADDGLFVLGNGVITHNCDEKIFTFFTKLRKRIDNRMKGNYYGRFIIDSQPNSLESPIDEWIWDSGTKKNKKNLDFTSILHGCGYRFYTANVKYE